MKTECDYLSGWIKKRSHTQKSHPKVVNPRDIAEERKKKKKKKIQGCFGEHLCDGEGGSEVLKAQLTGTGISRPQEGESMYEGEGEGGGGTVGSCVKTV